MAFLFRSDPRSSLFFFPFLPLWTEKCLFFFSFPSSRKTAIPFRFLRLAILTLFSSGSPPFPFPPRRSFSLLPFPPPKRQRSLFFSLLVSRDRSSKNPFSRALSPLPCRENPHSLFLFKSFFFLLIGLPLSFFFLRHQQHIGV